MRKTTFFAGLGATALSVLLAGCLNGNTGSPNEADEANLVIHAGVKDVNKVGGGLGKLSTITLHKLIITLTSGTAGDSVRRDTILAGTQGFGATATADQEFKKPYAIKPLRSWTVVVKTLDVNDSLVHYDSVVATKLLVGETRAVVMNLASRFVMYEAKFTVPDSLRSNTSGMAQKLLINRFVMKVDGVVRVDSSRAPSVFTPSTVGPPANLLVHTVRFDYINVSDTPDVRLEFYGRVEGVTNDTLLFAHLFENVTPTNPNPSGVSPVYVGPGAGGTGGAELGMTVNIGKVGTVVFETNISGNVFKAAVPE